MYFEPVLSYLATLVNDISLMNLSILPHGDLYIVWLPSSNPPGLYKYSRTFLLNSILSIFVIPLLNSVR
jgi:hypothetical protein